MFNVIAQLLGMFVQWNDFNFEDCMLIKGKLRNKVSYCSCLIHGFNLLALLQQPLLLSNSGQLKQVETSCFSMTSCLHYSVDSMSTMYYWNSYVKALIYFAFSISCILSKYNRNMLLDFHPRLLFQENLECLWNERNKESNGIIINLKSF